MQNVLINLLQYNDTANCNINRPNKQQLVAFKLRLEAAGLEVKMRESRGNNVKAACGQLDSNTNKRINKTAQNQQTLILTNFLRINKTIISHLRKRKMVHTIKNTDLLIYNTLNKMKKLELIDINKSYDSNVPVLKNVSFSVENGEFLVLLGPSGCGKSTILSIIAGFEKQNDVSVIIDGINCDTVSCQKRDIAMVFQNYAL